MSKLEEARMALKAANELQKATEEDVQKAESEYPKLAILTLNKSTNVEFSIDKDGNFLPFVTFIHAPTDQAIKVSLTNLLKILFHASRIGVSDEDQCRGGPGK